MKKIWLRIISGKRKKNIVLMLFGIMVVLGLSGCHYESKGEYMKNVLQEYDKQSDALMQSIIEALEAQDSKALKELFSPYALKYAENIDEKIEELMEFYPGSNGGLNGDCISEGGKYYGDLMLNGLYTIINDEKTYQINFVTIPYNKKEPEKEGLYLIEVMTEEAKPEGFKWRNEDDEPGIYVLDPQEKHW